MTDASSIRTFVLHAPESERLDALLARLQLSRDVGYFHRCLCEPDQSRLVLVAALGDHDCGLCVVNLAPTYPPFKRVGIPEIQDLNVQTDSRRSGVGAALVLAAENLVRAQGYDTIGLGVGLGPSYGAAQRLYARLGYVPDGAGVSYDGGPVRAGELRPSDDLLCLYMTKNLSEQTT